jgi:L-ascorbate metabolism protein UlaG (beta-lactamase superfamily)
MDPKASGRDPGVLAGEGPATRPGISRAAFLKGSVSGAALLAAGLGLAHHATAAERGEPVVSSAQTPGDEAVAPVQLEWLGWSHFRFTSPTGKIILTNPFLDNPDSPVRLDDIAKADLILTPNGHQDEIGSTVQIAQKTGARIFAPGELQSWFIEQGVPQAQFPQRFAAPGDRLQLEGITIFMVGGNHGSGLPRPTAQNPYGGPAVGFVIVFETGWTVYFAGSAPAMADQALWAELYRPHLAILHLGANHAPHDFAMQVRLLQTRNPSLAMVMPHHLRASPGAGQVNFGEAQALMDFMQLGLTITMPQLGQLYQFRPGPPR